MLNINQIYNEDCLSGMTACEYFIRTYTNPGDIVLDPCAGSATTAVSAINTNRNFICFEKDKEIYSKAKERILKAQNNI